MTNATLQMQAPVARPQRRGRRGVDHKRQRWGWLFVAPFAVIFALFLLAPLVYAFWTSLQIKTLAFGTQFVWFDNYVKAFTDPQFLDGVWLVIRFSIVLIPVQM